MTHFWQRFYDVARRYPENIAVLDKGQALTYHDLAQGAARLGEDLKRRGVTAEDMVGLAIEKSSAYITALLAVWYAGGAFVPLPPDLPKTRKDYITTETDMTHILTLQDVQRMKQQADEKIIPYPVTADMLAYTIYTSGSTGQPKGVMVEHKGILNFLDAQIEMFQTTQTSRYLFYLSLNFDASISDIGVALLSGAVLVIETDADLRDVRYMRDILHRHHITHTDLPPSLLKVLDVEDMPESLQTIIIGGESSPPDIVRRWAEKMRVVNVYGPTEATVCTSMCLCDAEKWTVPLVGDVFPEMAYHIVEDELYISGLGLARGYLNKPELTAKKFILYNGVRMYKTGDKVRALKNGEIEFLGRIDRQFKIRGQLVEPEEIEQHLRQYAGVKQAAVLKRPLRQGGADALLAFVTGDLPQDIEKQLNEKLLKWMVPQHIETLQAMPLTVTGKIDYSVLRQLKITNTHVQDYVPPETQLEEKLFLLWQEVLGHCDFGVTDNFFDIGGDSLAVMTMCLLAERAGFDLSPTVLIGYTNIRALTQYFAAGEDAGATCLSREGLIADIAFDEAVFKKIEQAKQRPANDRKDMRNILLTGATGSLGGYILRSLLEKTDAKIYCLIRAADDAQAAARLPIKDERIIAVAGDLTQFSFGWPKDIYQNMADKIDAVYHCAAWVNIVQDYKTLRPANVGAVEHLLDFALIGRRKSLHMASTLSVFVATDQNTGTVFENDRLEKTQKIYGGYAQTKWAAEYMLLQVPKTACAITHYRFGLITGDSQTGNSGKTDFLNMFVRGIAGMGSVPIGSERLEMDITPVDYAAKAMVDLSLYGKEEIYHIANKTGLTCGRLVQVLEEYDVNLLEMPAQDWQRQFQNMNLNAEQTAAFFALCRCFQGQDDFTRYRTMDLFQATDIVFDSRLTDRDLNYTCPKVTQALLKTYCDAILNTRRDTKRQSA